MGISRRRFLTALGGLAVPLADPLGLAKALASTGMGGLFSQELERYHFAQIRYRGGDWDPDPTAAIRLTEEIVKRTSVVASTTRKNLSILSPDLFSYPMIYITGHYDFQPFSQEETQRLRQYLDYGGFLLADDCLGHPGYDFDKAIRRELARLYPEKSLKRLHRDHSVFRSFYLIKTLGGRRIVSPYLEGIDIGDRTAVLYCQNDIGCAWERDEAGRWVHPCLPGGERQRRLAFQLGVNIVLYALSQDYKQDRIHLPFIRQRI
jgi:hypothetical protein